MDVGGTLAAMPRAAAFAGLPDAWAWSPNPRFHFTAALTTDKEHAVQSNVRDGYDADLVRAVLSFARDRSDEILADRRPLIPLLGFDAPGRDFDTVAVVAPAVHGHYAADNPELNAVVHMVFPGWHFEFAGTETVGEAKFRYSHPQGLRASTLDREPLPYLKMRYDNTKTGAGSEGPDRGFTKPAVLMRELPLLEGTENSFVEFENFQGRVWRVEWAGTWVLIDGDDRRTRSLDEVRAFAEAAITDR